MSNQPSAPTLVKSSPEVSFRTVRGAAPRVAVKRPAPKPKKRRRRLGLPLSFVLFWVLPMLVVSWYMWARAADQYASYVGFSVRTEEVSSAIEILGGITDLSTGSSSDTDILYGFLTSQELVRQVDEEVDLGKIWSRVSPRQDPIYSYDDSGTIEDLLNHWERMVAITYDSGAGLIDLKVLAFDPRDAQIIAESVLRKSTEMINELSAIARQDAIGYAQQELEATVERLKVVRRAVTEFRNRTQIVDPSIDTQNQMGLLITLQQQLAEALIDLDLLENTTQSSDPRILQASRRVEVIQSRIEAERSKLGLGNTGEEGDVFATLVGEYESLIVDREFAEAAYTGALAAYDTALAEARRQSRYLAPHVRPTLAERAEYPKRRNIVMLFGLFLLFAWAIGLLIHFSLRDRR